MFEVMLAKTGNAAAGGQMGSILLLVVFMVIFWLFIIRPQKKKDQQAKAMQDSLVNGDKVTTIGGIVGTVRSVKDDTVVIETGSDKAKLVFKKWAIGAVDSMKSDKKADKKAEEAETETETNETTEE